MISADLINQARSDGLKITLSADGEIRAVGNPQTLERWIKPLRDEREQLRQWLKDELTLRDWLIANGDTAEGAQEVIDLCARDTEARSFFLGLANKHFASKSS